MDLCDVDADFADLLAGEEDGMNLDDSNADDAAAPQGLTAGRKPSTHGSDDNVPALDKPVKTTAAADSGTVGKLDTTEDSTTATKEHMVIAEAASVETAKQPTAGSGSKPTFAGRKRQMLVPIAAATAKKPTLDAPAATKPALEKQQSVAATPLESAGPSISPKSTAPATTAASGLESAASSPLKGPAPACTNSSEPQTTNNKEGADMAAEAAGEDKEVQSPLKSQPAAADGTKPAVTAAGRKMGLAMVVKTAPPAADSKAAEPTKTSNASKIAATKSHPAKPPIAKALAKSNKTPDGWADAAPADCPKLPKRAKTAFMFFTEDKRADVKAANPGLKLGEVSKELGKLWGNLTAEEKKVYEDKAITDKERVAQELEAMDPAELAAAKAAAKASKQDKKADKENKASKTSGKTAATSSKGGPGDCIAEESTANEKKENEKKVSSAEAAAKKAEKAEEREKKRAKLAEVALGKAAFKIYHNEHFKEFKLADPEASLDELNTVVLDAYKALPEEEQQQYLQKARDASEAQAALKLANKREAPADSAASASRSKKARKAAAAIAVGNDGEEWQPATGADAAAVETDGEESDREDVDWDGYPASAVISHTTDGKSLLVARKGVSLDEYGKVPAQPVKQLLRGGDCKSAGTLHVSPEMFEEYEQFCNRFWQAVRTHTDKDGQLDLNGLEDGSPLEACYLLGKLQDSCYLLNKKEAKPPKRIKGRMEGPFERAITVPAMRLSLVVQRLLELERRSSKAAKHYAETLLAKIKTAKSLDEVKAAAAEVPSVAV